MSEVKKSYAGLEKISTGVYILEDIAYVLSRISAPLALELSEAIEEITGGRDMMKIAFGEAIDINFKHAQQSSVNLLNLALNLPSKLNENNQ